MTHDFRWQDPIEILRPPRGFLFWAAGLVFLILGCNILTAAELKITGGLTHNQVIQRDTRGFGEVKLWGEIEGVSGGVIELRVVRNSLTLEGLDWHPIGKVDNSQWGGQLRGIPTGGPYRVDLRVMGAAAITSIHDVLVGDIWVLAGQSNMEGYANLVDVEPPQALVHSYDMTNQWVVAEEPLHTLVSAADRVHWIPNDAKQQVRLEGETLRKYIAERTKGAGLGLPFAAELVRRTGVPIGLIPRAHGGTTMDQWDPAQRERGGDSLYGSMLLGVRKAGGRVAGFLWYQGESDAIGKQGQAYQQKFERFVAAVRNDLGQPSLPFYYVQIGRVLASPATKMPDWNVVQEAQRRAEQNLQRVGMVASADLDLDDPIHIGTQGLKHLGKRLANLACHDLFPNTADCGRLKRGPRPVSAVFRDGVVQVSFAEVNGRLISPGRMSGFSIQNAEGESVQLIFRAKMSPDDPAAVLLYIWNKPPAGATLHYGWGLDPYCNLEDGAGMTVPVFGPLEIRAE